MQVPSEEQDYAKVPWVPTVSGHTCIMAVVTSAADPAPPMGPSDPVLIGDRHVAQRNVDVHAIAPSARSYAHVFGVPTAWREGLVLTARRAPIAEFAPHFGYTRVAHAPPEIAASDIERFYFQRVEDLGKDVNLGTSTGLTPDIGDQLALVIQFSGKQAPGSAAVYRIEAWRDQQPPERDHVHAARSSALKEVPDGNSPHDEPLLHDRHRAHAQRRRRRRGGVRAAQRHGAPRSEPDQGIRDDRQGHVSHHGDAQVSVRGRRPATLGMGHQVLPSRTTTRCLARRRPRAAIVSCRGRPAARPPTTTPRRARTTASPRSSSGRWARGRLRRAPGWQVQAARSRRGANGRRSRARVE